MDYNTDLLQEITIEFDKLENNLISEINELKASTELILKELTLYLNISANDITSIKDDSIKLKDVVVNMQDYVKKLDFIENKILEFPSEIQQFSSSLKETQAISESTQKKYFIANTNNLKKMIQSFNIKINELKDEIVNQKKFIEKIYYQMELVISSLKDYREDLNKEEGHLINVINQLIKSQNESELAGIKLHETETSTAASIRNAKLQFWGKMAALILGSGGFLWFVIETIIKYVTK